jgi:hypothetical protein
MTDSRDLQIHANAEFRKAVGHLDAAMEFIGWLNFHGAPKDDREHEEKLRKLVDAFKEEINERIG